MSIVMSVLYGDLTYYTAIDSSHVFHIGEHPDSNLVIPNLGYDLTVVPNGKNFQIDVSNNQGKRTIYADFDVSTVIDFKKKIAVYISESVGRPAFVQIPADCEIHIGKSDKISSDGSRNEIVLDLPFVSRNHFKIVRENGHTTVHDNNSTNGLFLNGKTAILFQA